MSSPIGDALRAQAAALCALADAADAHEHNAASTDDPWLALPAAAVVPGYAMRGRVVVDAARRGELEVSAGRPPRVRRSELERWLTTRKIRPTQPAAESAAADEYAQVVNAVEHRGAAR